MDKLIVLVLCTGNSCRSQMAEGFLRKYHGDVLDVHSAGTDPKDEVHPLAVKVMGEVGVDITGHRPKNSSEYLGRLPVRHLLIVCGSADKSCPRIWPGVTSRTFIPFDDPANFAGTDAEMLAEFRRVRDQIHAAMRDFKADASLWSTTLTEQRR